MIVCPSYCTCNAPTLSRPSINKMDDARLVTTLAMICPFDPPEQQVLLMARDMSERAETIISLLEITTHDVSEAGDVRH